MRVPFGWLNEFVCDLPAPQEVARRLTLAGLEVESVSEPDPRLVDGIVTARILETAKHPNADRLTLCRVDDGTAVLPIVCGATNMKAGDSVVLARPGTVLPDGRKIQKSKIRGEESRGMLCAAVELGMEDDRAGILVLDPSVAPGLGAATLLGIDEAVIEIAVTPNRGDCLSMRGVAREIAAICDLGLSPAYHAAPAPRGGVGRVPVRIEAGDVCAFYSGIEIGDVRVGPSPEWLRARLRACGLRPINNVVDVTNLVLWEYGQPLHAFDLDLLSGPEIVVSRAGHERKIRTLDGEERALEAQDLVIRDADRVVALAGVMGGAGTAVSETTRKVFLESAIFSPSRVRSTSRRLGLISDSSYRFERGVDPAGVEIALLRAAELIAELGGGAVAQGVSRAGKAEVRRSSVTLRTERISRVLGVDVPAAETKGLLERLGAIAEPAEVGAFVVTPPSHRHDLEREIDLIEEVARLHGYDRIPSEAPLLTRATPVSRGARDAVARVRLALCARGATEIVPLAFCSPDENSRFRGLHPIEHSAVIVENPLRSDAGELRRSLLPGLLTARSANVRAGTARSDLFAVGRTFCVGAPATEIDTVAGLLAGPRRTRSPRDEGGPELGDVKGVVSHAVAAMGCVDEPLWCGTSARGDLHPRAAAEIRLGERSLGYAGEVHPDALAAAGLDGPVFVFELDLGALSACAGKKREFRPLPRFPASTRDVSFLVPDDMEAGRIVAEASRSREPLLEKIVVFDEYRGTGLAAGKKALAFRLTYRADDRTLTEEEVAGTHERVVAGLVSALEIEPRA